MPSLLHLLAIGKIKPDREALEAALCRNLGVLPQQDWPLAPLSWLGEGNDPVGFYWLRADPVHLILQRDSFSLSEPAPLAVEPQDAQALLASLNQHFAADGLQFHIGDSGRWYLRLETAPAICTSVPEAAMGRDISPFMPQGEGAAEWNRLLNEMQMLLFEHPVNQAHEARGEPAINSIWLSGGGVLTNAIDPSDKVIYANSPLAKGLASTANLPCFAVPETAAVLLNQGVNQGKGEVVLVLDNAQDADSKWFVPLLQSLRSRKITQLTINLAVRDQLLQVSVTPIDLWKVWRKTKPLEAYFHG